MSESLDSTKPFRSALLPVFASDHWTLLVCHKESAELSVPMKAQQEAQILLRSLLHSEFVLPERANSAVQPQAPTSAAGIALAMLGRK